MRKWSGKLGDVCGYIKDCWSDFCTTVEEVCRHKSLPQIFGVIVVVVVFCFMMMLLWALVSFLVALPVWWLWNFVMPDLGLPVLSYWKAYALTLLCAILFRGNSVHLKE